MLKLHYSTIGKYNIGYFNKEEFNILNDEIFNQEVYKVDIKKDTPLIYDIGSHIGLSVIYFKQKYPNSRIVCFEPNPNVFPLLEENIICNNIKNVELHNSALSREEGETMLYIDNSGSDCFSTASFYKNAWNGKQETVGIKVKTERLSKYISEEKQIDILKIDVEGAESQIIKELINNDCLKKVKNIIIEFHPVKGMKLSNIINLLEENSFIVKIRKDRDSEELVYILGENTI